MLSIDLIRDTRHLCTRFSIDGIKGNVRWYSVIAFEFVHSLKTTRRLIAKQLVRFAFPQVLDHYCLLKRHLRSLPHSKK